MINENNLVNFARENEASSSSIEQLKVKALQKELKQAKKEVATSKEMKAEIMERTETGYTITETSRKFGLLKQNRETKDSIVKGFIQIIITNNYDDAQPIVTMEASELFADYELMDLEEKPIKEEEAKEYLIVLNGQNRIMAFSKLNAIRTPEEQFIIPNVRIRKDTTNVRKYLAYTNMVGHTWSATDKVRVASMASDCKTMKKVNELVEDGFNASTAATICIGRRIYPNEMKRLLTEGDMSFLTDEATKLAKAERFVTTAMKITGMSEKILTKRYYINGFNCFASAYTEEKAFDALGRLTINDFTSVRENYEFVEKLKTVMLSQVA